MGRIDIGRSFTFMFEDSDWVVKLILGALIFLVGVTLSIVLIGFLAFLVLSGYMVAIVRNVSRGEELPLPAWSDFGALFMDGLRVGGALFVWGLPALVGYLPLVVLMAMAGGQGQMGTAMETIITLLVFVCVCVLFLYSIFLALVSPIIVLRIAEEQRFAAAFQFGRIFSTLRANLGAVVLVVIATFVAQLLATLVGTLLCGVGVLLTVVWGMWVQGHLIGQLGRLMHPQEVELTPAS